MNKTVLRSPKMAAVKDQWNELEPVIMKLWEDFADSREKIFYRKGWIFNTVADLMKHQKATVESVAESVEGTAGDYPAPSGPADMGDTKWKSEFFVYRSHLMNQIRPVAARLKANPTEEDRKAYAELDAALNAIDAEYEKAYKAHMRRDSEAAKQDYRGEHQAPGRGSGAPLWDLTANDIYPDDFYRTYNEYVYDDSRAIIGLVLDAHRRPNKEVKVYRAIPKDAPRKINPGDWVALGRRYAVEHGVSALNGSYVIVSKTVFARDLFTDGNSLAEWGYDPQSSYQGGFRPSRR